MKQKLMTMLEMQDAMNSKVDLDWRHAGFEWYRAIWIEAAEMLDHYGWKWWKLQKPDVMQVKLEVVDIVHFSLSIRLLSGKTFDEIANSIAKDFMNPVIVDDVPSGIELLAKQTLIDNQAHFSIIAGVMIWLQMSFDELHEIYVGKNVLNVFRQDKGYKSGRYNKIWCGREDNEHLADIITSLDSNKLTFKDDVYDALSRAYVS